MNVHAFISCFQARSTSVPLPNENSSASWSRYMTLVLEEVADDLKLECAHRPEGDNRKGREYLWDFTYYSLHGGPYDQPAIIVEHENSYDNDAFMIDFWKIMVGFAPLRIMIGYVANEKGMEGRRRWVAQVARTAGWIYPQGTTDLVILRTYGMPNWECLVRYSDSREFVPYEVAPPWETMKGRRRPAVV